MLMSQGVELLVYGMGTVVLFLSLLVLATTLMSRSVHAVARWFPEAEEPVGTARDAGARRPMPLAGSASGGELNPATRAAIVAAVHHYRHRRS